jgi:hypothetical protein
VAVVVTLRKGYDLEYIWKQVDGGPAKDAANYYIQASESGGEPAVMYKYAAWATACVTGRGAAGVPATRRSLW